MIMNKIEKGKTALITIGILSLVFSIAFLVLGIVMVVGSLGGENVDVLKYIQNNFQKNPSLEELSQFCGYQKNYFCEYFKKNFNTTYKEYLSSVKINHSKKLLKLTNKSIKEIATECGFNSANNFIRKFKETSIITPKEYRQLYLKTMK